MRPVVLENRYSGSWHQFVALLCSPPACACGSARSSCNPNSVHSRHLLSQRPTSRLPGMVIPRPSPSLRTTTPLSPLLRIDFALPGLGWSY